MSTHTFIGVAPVSIKCGSCKTPHSSVQEVKDCYANAAAWELYVSSGQAEADQLAEIAAEAAVERYFERGVDDGFDEWEAAMGLLSYEEARDAAEARAAHEAWTRTSV